MRLLRLDSRCCYGGGRNPVYRRVGSSHKARFTLLIFWTRTLSDDWVTVFWSAELVALYWVAARSNDRSLLFGTLLIGLVVVFQHFWFALDFLFEATHWPAVYCGHSRAMVYRVLSCRGTSARLVVGSRGLRSRGTSKIESYVRGAWYRESLWIPQCRTVSIYDSIHA